MYSENYEGIEEEQKSKYNEAFNQLSRINEQWNSCHSHRKRGNLIQWNVALDCVWSELAGDKLTKQGSFDKYEEYIKLIVKHRNNKVILYQVLMKKEIFLRRLQNSQGKGSVYADSSEDDFD